MVYTFFDKKTGPATSVIEKLAEELHKLVIKKFKRRKVYVGFKYNVWAAESAEMGSLSLHKILDFLMVKIRKDIRKYDVFGDFLKFP